MDATRRAMMNVSGLDFLGFLERIGGCLIGTARRSIKAFRQWNKNQRTRRVLLNMNNHMLKDIGISRLDAMQEGREAFWQY